MRTIILLIIGVMGSALNVHAEIAQSQSSEGANVFIISPVNDEIVPATFTVRFGLQGMGIAPAGIQVAGTGHHHLLLDFDGSPDLKLPLPANENLIHFGKGQTETELTLAPGKHTLQLLLGDYLHRPHDSPLQSEVITVYVLESE